jgi:hypothetical protein
LQAMGETNPLLEGRRFLRREVLAHACELYRQRYSTVDGFITATMELVSFSAWK